MEVAIGSDSRETPIHATTREGKNDLLYDDHKVDDDRLPSPKKNPDLQEILTDQYIKRYVNRVACTI